MAVEDVEKLLDWASWFMDGTSRVGCGLRFLRSHEIVKINVDPRRIPDSTSSSCWRLNGEKKPILFTLEGL